MSHLRTLVRLARSIKTRLSGSGGARLALQSWKAGETMSWTTAISSAVLVGTLVISPASASAQGRGHAEKAEKPHKEKHAATTGHSSAVPHDIVIDRDGHVRVIREYARSGSLPPGLAKREALPPGLQKQLHENGELPPGLQKRLVPVPTVLVHRLPVVPSYYHRYFAGDDLLVIDTRTNRLIAIIPNVWN